MEQLILNYKIYTLKVKGETEIRYVGLTKRTLTRRLSSHFADSKKRNTHKDYWIRKNEFNIEIVLVEENISSLEEANIREMYWIQYFKDLGCDLVNSTNGGDGTAGLRVSDEHKRKLSELNKGKKLSEEQKKKIGDGRRGQKFTPDQKENHRLSKQNISDETKFKQKLIKIKAWLINNNYNIENLTELEIIKLRESIKYLNENKKYELEELGKIKTIEEFKEREKLIKIEKERIKVQEEKNKIEREVAKELKKEENRIKAEIKHQEILQRKKEKEENLKRKIEEGSIRAIEKDGKTIYVPVMSDEQKLKNSEYNKTHKQSPESIQKRVESYKKYYEENPDKKVKLTDEQKEHLSKINTGKKYSDETKQKHSINSRGNGNNCAKINEDDVREIRRLINEENVLSRKVAEQFNMEYSTIRKIIQRKLWKHLD